MKKQTCYVLIISTQFPSYHPKARQDTNFEFKILQGTKLHTIRANYELWKKRFEKIDKGEAYLSVRRWEGKPRHSKQEELFKFDKTDGIGLDKINIENLFSDRISKIRRVARNDGLSLLDFINWFMPYKINRPIAIIHFTEFRY